MIRSFTHACSSARGGITVRGREGEATGAVAAARRDEEDRFAAAGTGADDDLADPFRDGLETTVSARIN